MSNDRPIFGTVFMLGTSQELIAHIRTQLKNKHTATFNSLKEPLALIDDALHMGIAKINELNSYQDEAQAAFSEGELLAMTLMDELAKPSQQANKALYDMAESLYFLLSERASA